MTAVFIAGFEIDCTIRQEPELKSEITEYPVETGAAVVDHIRPTPTTLVLEGIVSDTPYGDLRTRRGMDLDLLNPRGLPSEQAYAHLVAVHEAREPITIETELAVYENMALESLSFTPNNTDALFFTATFKQVRLIVNERTTVKVSVPRGSKKVDRGAKAVEWNKEPPKSVVSRALGALGFGD